MSDKCFIEVGVHQGSFACNSDERGDRSYNEWCVTWNTACSCSGTDKWTYGRLQRTFDLLKTTLESKGMNINIKTKLTMSGTEGKTSRSKIYLSSMCDKRVITTSMMWTKCWCWVHRRSMKKKKLSAALAQGFVYAGCSHMTAGTVAKKLGKGAETVTSFCCLGDTLNANDNSESIVTAKTRIA